MLELLLAAILAQCGNGVIDPGENCFNCPEDVVCNFCENCFDGECIKVPLCTCGNGFPDPGENCETCPSDVQCLDGEDCVGGKCMVKCVPSTQPMEIVFLMDVSGSMNDEGLLLCESITSVEAELESLGLDVTVHLLSIWQFGWETNFFPCLTATVLDVTGVGLHQESWGPATTAMADLFPWSAPTRIIVPMSDEGPFQGNPCNDPGDDRDSITDAIAAANANGVFVSPIMGSGAGPCTVGLGQDLADGTGGLLGVPGVDIADAIVTLVQDTLCPCVLDLNGDGMVGITDFLALLAAWGPNPGHPADFDGDDIVGITDFLLLLASWGPCP